MSNPIGWVEIPVLDMDNAIAFYNEVFGWSLEAQPFGDTSIMAMFPSEEGAPGAAGALVLNTSEYEPSETAGALVYFSCDSCTEYNEKTERAGGRVLIPTQPIPPYGYRSVIVDSEGNRIAFHSMVE